MCQRIVAGSCQCICQVRSGRTHCLHGRYTLVYQQVGAQQGIAGFKRLHNAGHLGYPGSERVVIDAHQVIVQRIEGVQLRQARLELTLMGADGILQLLRPCAVPCDQAQLADVAGHGIGVVAHLAHQCVAPDMGINKFVELALQIPLVGDAENDDQQQGQHPGSKSNQQAFFEFHIFESHLYPILLFIPGRCEAPIRQRVVCGSWWHVGSSHFFLVLVPPAVGCAGFSPVPISFSPHNLRLRQCRHTCRFSHRPPGVHPPG